MPQFTTIGIHHPSLLSLLYAHFGYSPPTPPPHSLIPSISLVAQFPPGYLPYAGFHFHGNEGITAPPSPSDFDISPAYIPQCKLSGQSKGNLNASPKGKLYFDSGNSSCRGFSPHQSRKASVRILGHFRVFITDQLRQWLLQCSGLPHSYNSLTLRETAKRPLSSGFLFIQTRGVLALGDGLLPRSRRAELIKQPSYAVCILYYPEYVR